MTPPRRTRRTRWRRGGPELFAALLVFAAGFGLGRWSDGKSATVDEPSPRIASHGAAAPRRDVSRHEHPAVEPPPRTTPAAPVAIVVDDLGRSVEVVADLRRLGVALSYAVLPFESRTSEVVEHLARHGEEILCHLPMEAHQGVDPGPGALMLAMDAAALRSSTREALARVPGAVGVNNHMGSALSEDSRAMEAVLRVLAERELYFLDSRTSAASVGYGIAARLGVAAAQRRVFLDGERDVESVREQFLRLLALAREGEPVVAIGHPYPETLDVLRSEIPVALARGYRFVRVSQVVSRSVVAQDLGRAAAQGAEAAGDAG